MVSSFRSIYRFLNPWILPQTKRLLCPTSPSTLRVATSPSRGGLGSPESFASSPEAPLLGELAAKQTERLEGRNTCPGSSCFRFRDPEVLPQIERLLCPTSPSSLRDATSPSRGGLGSPESFASSPEAPLLGELSAKQTERLEGRNTFPCKQHLTVSKSVAPASDKASALSNLSVIPSGCHLP